MLHRLVITFSCCAALAAWGQERPGIAIFDLKGIGTQPMQAEAASVAVVRGVRELDAFEVISAEDLRNMLSIERQKALLGMDNDSMSSSVTALGVRHHVVGSVTHTSSGFSAELRLLDTTDGKVISQKAVPEQPTLEAVSRALFGLAQELLGPLLFLEQGTLLVRTREEGAEVIVDDVTRGSTPLPAALKMPRGKHRLTVKKDGFISRVSEVTVKRDQLTLEDVTLVPSPDYVHAYAARNNRMRLGAWIGTAVAVAGVTTALIIDRVVVEKKYQDEFLPRQQVLQAYAFNPQLDPSLFLDPVAQTCASDTAKCRTETQDLANSIQTLQTVSWVMLGVGIAGAVGAAYCWISGEDPSRYAQLVASLSPSGGGLALVGHW